MRILLDTNIFIPLEDSFLEIDEKLAELNRLVSGKHKLLIHPSTYLDICRDKDPARKNRSLSRLSKYSELESPPELEADLEAHLFGVPKKDNDTVDNKILFALHKNCIHWLITEDGGIHKKAKKIGEEERVLTVDQAIRALSGEDREHINLYPNIQNVPCYSLDLSDVFLIHYGMDIQDSITGIKTSVLKQDVMHGHGLRRKKFKLYVSIKLKRVQ